jgi:hypothetical protein
MRAAVLALAATSFGAAYGAIVGFGGARLDAGLALEGSVVVAVVATFAAVVPLSYASRAILAATAGAIPLGLAAVHLGPLARLGDVGVGHALAGLAMVLGLPAALLFRSRYRALPEARIILGVALAASAPAAVLAALDAIAPGTASAMRVIDGAMLVSIALGGLGFMGAETSAGCAQWAALVVGAFVAGPALRAGDAAWRGTGHDTLTLTTAALGALVAATLLGFALFQLFAAALAGRARAVDVHRAVGAGASDPSPRFHSGFSD